MHYDHDIRISGQFIEHCREVGEFHLQGMELFTDTRTRVLERFNKFRGTLVTCGVELVGGDAVIGRSLIWRRRGCARGGNDEESCALEEDDFSRAAGFCESGKML